MVTSGRWGSSRGRGPGNVVARVVLLAFVGLSFACGSTERLLPLEEEIPVLASYGATADGLARKPVRVQSDARPAGPLDIVFHDYGEAGQERASSILLRYDQGGVNHAHRDEYGKLVFPFQALIVLSRRGADFEGGAFQLHEEREEGRVTHDIVVDEGDLLVFAGKAKPDRNGGPAIPLRHGMSTVTAGTRFGVGIVFNLAK